MSDTMAPMSFNHTNRDHLIPLLEASKGLGERGPRERQVYASTRSEDNEHKVHGQRPHETEDAQITPKQELRLSRNTCIKAPRRGQRQD